MGLAITRLVLRAFCDIGNDNEEKREQLISAIVLHWKFPRE